VLGYIAKFASSPSNCERIPPFGGEVGLTPNNLPIRRYNFIKFVRRLTRRKFTQEAQLMLTNPREAFRGQSRSPNMVPFDILGTVSH